MSTSEINQLKLNLIAWINQLSDVRMLAFLEGLKTSRSKDDWWDQLSTEQQNIVLRGIKDADEKNTISSEQFWKHLKDD
ncbi:MAG: hypothetical protein KDD36_05535 [Flavobacteriales bacterium]|nr:hypothetical protein [Flavobacteriales bacterium]